MNAPRPDETRAADAEREAVRRLLRPLREAPPPDWDAARAARVWQGIERRRGGGGARTGWLPWALAATAAALALTFWPTAPSDRGPNQPTVASQPAAEPASPMVGRRLTDAATLPSGARVRVSGGAVRVAEADRHRTRLVLESGAVTSEVPSLRPGESYVVETPGAFVAVRGTRFTVEVGPAGETRVVVTEGVVEVTPRDGRPATLVPAGESLVLKPAEVTPEAARAAEAAGDWRRAVALWNAIAAAAEEPLERHNALVAAGRLLSRHAPAQAVEHWRRIAPELRGGIHAEEAAWRMAEALHRAGRLHEAREAGRRFRETFPESPYAAATRHW